MRIFGLQMTPKWSQKSTFFATGRPRRNRAPTAARTLLSILGQTPKSLKKPLLILSAGWNPPFQLLKPAGSQDQFQNDPKRPQISSKIANCGQLGTLGGPRWDCHGPKDANGTKKVTQIHQKSPENNVKLIIEATEFSY